MAHLKYKPHLVIINNNLKLSRRWSSNKSLGLRSLLPLKAYIVFNFRSHEINQGTHKLTRILTLIKKNIYINNTLVIEVYSSKFGISSLKHKIERSGATHLQLSPLYDQPNRKSMKPNLHFCCFLSSSLKLWITDYFGA